MANAKLVRKGISLRDLSTDCVGLMLDIFMTSTHDGKTYNFWGTKFVDIIPADTTLTAEQQKYYGKGKGSPAKHDRFVFLQANGHYFISPKTHEMDKAMLLLLVEPKIISNGENRTGS